MKKNLFPRRRTPLVPAIFAVGLSLTGCAPSGCAPSGWAPRIQPEQELKAGQRAFFFQLQDATGIELAKHDPDTGDTWSATAYRKVPASSTEPATWELRSGPGGQELVDHLANGPFIAHLLDTLLTLQVVEPAPAGPPEGFGLRPPHFAIRLKSDTGTIREILLGTRDRKSGGSYAEIPPSTQITIVRGAALQMLTNLTGFDELRQRNILAPLASDDVEEVELFRQRKPFFYAQREGETWTNRKNKPHPGRRAEVGALLDRLTHSRALAFVDDPELNSKLVAAASAKPELEAVLRGRKGQETRLKLRTERVAGREALVALSSLRPGVAFIAFPEMTGYFEPFQK